MMIELPDPIVRKLVNRYRRLRRFEREGVTFLIPQEQELILTALSELESYVEEHYDLFYTEK